MEKQRKIAELVCIVCPNGCNLQVESITEELRGEPEFIVSGNRCKRGKEFAKTEMTAPKRMICSTVRTAFQAIPVVPVKLSAEIPKQRIFDVMDEIKKVRVTMPIRRGDVVLHNVCNLGVDVIATNSITTQL